MIEIHFDGGAVHVGQGRFVCGYGFTVKYGKKVYQGAKIIDRGNILTNQVGEYSGLIAALRALEKLQNDGAIPKNVPCQIFGDSMLVVKMVSGVWGGQRSSSQNHKKARHLQPLLAEAQRLMPLGATIHWIPRELNEYCDGLYNKALIKYRYELLH